MVDASSKICEIETPVLKLEILHSYILWCNKQKKIRKYKNVKTLNFQVERSPYIGVYIELQIGVWLIIFPWN